MRKLYENGNTKIVKTYTVCHNATMKCSVELCEILKSSQPDLKSGTAFFSISYWD